MVALECMKHGVPMSNIVAGMTGATSPAPLPGTLALTLAETLAALVMLNVFEPGYPMIFSNWPLVIDLRTGAFVVARWHCLMLLLLNSQTVWAYPQDAHLV